MEFSNRYYATLLANSPTKAAEYLANCQWKGLITEETKVEDADELKMMTEYLRSVWIKVRPNFKPETIRAKYAEATKDL